MTGELLALGVSHKTAPLAVRERLALPEGRAAAVLAELTAHEAIHEAVAISTCNRAELYLMSSDTVMAESAALGILANQAGIPPMELTGSLYDKRGIEAVRHLFAVAAGLDSMIVGEAEIQGQVKRAYELALVEGATGPITNRLFREALAAGKRVRTETRVGRSRVSVSSVAVELAADMLGDLSTRRVLVIGAGENGELTAKALRERGVHTVFVANRHYDRAIGLAQRFDGTAVRIDDLPGQLAAADIVVSCTSSPHQILGREELEVVARGRDGRRLVLLDIAVPRDVDARVRDLPGVTLFDMDDLQRAVAQTLDTRQAEASRARALVEQDTERFERWLSSLDVVPTIASLRARGNDIVDQVLQENEQRWESLSEADRERLRVMARAVVSRMLHEPTLRLKGSVGEDTAYVYVHALRELFGLDDGPPSLEGERSTGAAITELETHRRQRRVRLGTRGSPLALAQAGLVRDLLTELGEGVELVPITTTGDALPGGAPPGEDKSRFVKEIDEALLRGQVDLAVHSAKDVPSELPDGLAIVAVPQRADARDALCARGAGGLDSLREGATVGTASLRRRAQLLAARPDLRVLPLRGNVDTRLRRLEEGELDAVVLAAAGLARLGVGRGVGIAQEEMTPAPGQGCLALEARADDERTRSVAGRLTHPASLTALSAERALVRAIDASCHTPVGAFAQSRDGGSVRMDAFAGLPDGSAWVRDSLDGEAEEPAALGAAVGERLLAAGARELLERAESWDG